MKRLILIFLFGAAIPLSVLGAPLSYEFHFYYDNGKLSPDRDYTFVYDLLASPYNPPTVKALVYSGKILDVRGKELTSFVFSKPSFSEGQLSVSAPYRELGERAEFFDEQGNSLLTVVVNKASFACNNNGRCDYEGGEDAVVCPSDCSQSSGEAAELTRASTPLISQEPLIPAKASRSGEVISGLLTLIAGLAIIAGYLWWRRRKRVSNLQA